MFKPIHITIPEPCRQDWNSMSHNKQGAFCKSCKKNVIDFTTKTENEIYQILTQSTEPVCGRFNILQLNKPIRKTELNNGWLNWRIAAASFLSLFTAGKLFAVTDNEKKPTITNINNEKSVAKSDIFCNQDSLLLQSTKIEPVDTCLLTGRVIDSETKKPIEFATVILTAKDIKIPTDPNGIFQFVDVLTDSSIVQLSVSALGYQTQIVSSSYKNESLVIEMQLGNLIIEKKFESKMQVSLMGGAIFTKVRVVYHEETIQDRYDPKLDIRKKVRDKAKREGY